MAAAPRLMVVSVVVCFHVFTTRAVREPHCAAYEEEDTDSTRLQFVTQSLVPSATTCDREHTELWCCTLGYTELVWQKRLTTSGLWYNITNQSRRYIQENNQTLVMESVTKTFDETKYRCTARNESGYEISHTMDLVIKACQTWNEPPIAVQPAPDLRLLRLPGANITLPCRAVFGPDYETERRPANLTWRRDTLAPDGTVRSSSTWVAGVNNGTEDGRISISLSEGDQTMTSDLHITNVSAEDYGNYTCIMANAVGSVHRVVSLQEGDPNAVIIIKVTVFDRTSRIVALAIGLLMIFTLVAVVIYFAFGLDIRLYYKDRFKRPVDPSKSIDAFVVHAELCVPDQEFVVQRLRPYLEDEHQYKLCIAERDFIPGEPSINTYMSFLESSQCLLVIVSDGILADDWCRFILNYALHLESRNLVFLLYRKVTTWTDSPEDKMLKRAIKVASHIVTWSDMAANNGRSSAVCLSCLGMDGSHSHHRTTNQPRLPQCKAMEQDHFQEGSFQMSYVGDHSLGDDNCDTNPAMTKGVHVSDSPSSNSQNILPGSVVPTISPTNTSDPSPPPDVTRCCCYQSHSSPDHTTSGDGDSTSSGQGEMNARETRLWKQLRLALPPRVHRPESERSESGTAETAILTGSNI